MLISAHSCTRTAPDVLSELAFSADWQMLFSRLKNQIMLITQAQSPLGYLLVKEIVRYGIHAIVTVPEQQMIARWWKEIFTSDPHSTCMEEKAMNPETLIHRLLLKYGQLNAVWLHAEFAHVHALGYYWRSWIQALSGILKSNSRIIFSAALQSDGIASSSSRQWLSTATQELSNTLQWVKKSLHPSIPFTHIPPFLYQCAIQTRANKDASLNTSATVKEGIARLMLADKMLQGN